LTITFYSTKSLALEEKRMSERYFPTVKVFIVRVRIPDPFVAKSIELYEGAQYVSKSFVTGGIPSNRKVFYTVVDEGELREFLDKMERYGAQATVLD